MRGKVINLKCVLEEIKKEKTLILEETLKNGYPDNKNNKKSSELT